MMVSSTCWVGLRHLGREMQSWIAFHYSQASATARCNEFSIFMYFELFSVYCFFRPASNGQPAGLFCAIAPCMQKRLPTAIVFRRVIVQRHFRWEHLYFDLHRGTSAYAHQVIIMLLNFYLTAVCNDFPKVGLIPGADQ